MAVLPSQFSFPLVLYSLSQPSEHFVSGARALSDSRRALGTTLERKSIAALTLTAVGVVYGDIGTSPLYAMRECFHGPHAVAPTYENVLGVLSLIVYALLLVVSIKYIAIVLRADNQGEGGILALTALVPARATDSRRMLILLGIFGAALLYGDGMITPAITVLSAVEGLNVATPFFQPYVVPVAVAILIGIFSLQRYGTDRVGRLFGPVMVVWFIVIALLGVRWIMTEPAVLGAVDPAHAITFFRENGYHGFVILGAVFLVVTGGEALYADMGHFGRRPIRLAWFTLVLPALLLNYFGQGAMLLQRPEAAAQAFFMMTPTWLLLPVVAIATAAAIIASQALISGVFSLTRQAIQLGYFPRLDVEHTSRHEAGQVYVPQMNLLLALCTILIVVGFKSSSALAAAYGIAVTMTMVVTAILLHVVAVERWKWPVAVVGMMTTLFLTIDFAFLSANLIKIADGGWLPLVIGLAILTAMTTWKTGRRIVAERLTARALPLKDFLAEITARPPVRVPGTAVFMTAQPTGTPPALAHNVHYNKVLHEHVVLLTARTEPHPFVSEDERVTVEPLSDGISYVTVLYGFMDDPNIPIALEQACQRGADLDLVDITYFLGRETLIVTRQRGMAMWREKLFVFMARNAVRATAFFRLPPERVVELGVQVEM
jgi:KUP system potassium uptake protein